MKLPKYAPSSLSRQKGQGMSEYIIITALIAVAAIGVFASFGDVIGNQTAAMAQEMAGQDGATDIASAKTNAEKATERGDQKDTLSTYNAKN